MRLWRTSTKRVAEVVRLWRTSTQFSCSRGSKVLRLRLRRKTRGETRLLRLLAYRDFLEVHDRLIVVVLQAEVAGFRSGTSFRVAHAAPLVELRCRLAR